MAKKFSPFSGFNIGLLLFAVLFLGGSAYFMSSNQPVNTTSSASDSIQTLEGLLAKKGTAVYSPCKGIITDYAIVGFQSACTPLVVNASLTTNLLGKRVRATGTFQNGLFYATDLSLRTPLPTAKP